MQTPYLHFSIKHPSGNAQNYLTARICLLLSFPWDYLWWFLCAEGNASICVEKKGNQMVERPYKVLFK